MNILETFINITIGYFIHIYVSIYVITYICYMNEYMYIHTYNHRYVVIIERSRSKVFCTVAKSSNQGSTD